MLTPIELIEFPEHYKFSLLALLMSSESILNGKTPKYVRKLESSSILCTICDRIPILGILNIINQIIAESGPQVKSQ